MDADRWALTHQAIGPDEPVVEDDEDLLRDYSIIPLLAALPPTGVKELGPGIYYKGDEAGAARLLARFVEARRRRDADD